MLQKPKKLVTNTLNYFDIFEDPVQLNINGDRQLSSSLGGFLSVAVIAFIASQVVIQGLNMLHHNNASIIQMNEYQSDPHSISLNSSNNFKFAVQFAKDNVNLNLSNGSYFSFTSTFNQYLRNDDGTQTKYKSAIYYAPCNRNNFSEFGDDIYDSYQLQYAYCPQYINFTDSKTGLCPDIIKEINPSCLSGLDFHIKGSYLSMDFEFIQFKLMTCSQANALTIKGLNCKTTDLTSAFGTSEFKVNLYFSNNLIDPTNYHTPNKTFLDSIYWNLSPTVSKVADIFIDIETVRNAQSYFFVNVYENSTFYSIQSQYIRELQQFAATTLLEWNFRRSNQNHLTTRYYMKILDVISNIGGMTSLLTAFCLFVTVGYSRYKHQMILSNELYDYEPTNESKKPIVIHQNKIAPLQNKSLSESKSVSKYELKPAVGRKETRKNKFLTIMTATRKKSEPADAKGVKDYFETHLQKKRMLPYGEISYIKDLISSLCCRRNPDHVLAEKGRKQVLKDLDVIKMIEKMQEIDKLKLLLLNRYQREAFDFIEKPVITFDSQKPVHKKRYSAQHDVESISELSKSTTSIASSNHREDYTSLSKYGKLYAAYRYLQSDSEPRNYAYNKKLLDMIGEDLIKVFKQVDGILGENPDPRKFESTVEKILTEPDGGATTIVETERADLLLDSPKGDINKLV